ncbi:MAG: 50S rRNA methyltransferase [Candidatus Pelagibacter sp. TMED203]|nr:MAG: 50S rRNA methyltransferase [Candidatus Pelagibacter sp. TMED203]|tara:strand:- start:760 stop:1377 length:618 start_codon:yes stop_codon:yes gene_type:complete
MKKNQSSKSWIIKQHRDQFFKKSKVLGYRSRSAFKLIELNKKFKFISKRTSLIDIGSSPGGWSQVASEIIKNGKIIAIDKKPMEKIDKVKFYQNDFFDTKIQRKLLEILPEKVDVVISDMAADTTGNKSLDCIRTNLLCEEVIDFSVKIIKPEGKVISKLFMGEDFLKVKKKAEKKFKKVNFFKPESSRGESKETYIHCAYLNTL